MARLQRHGFTGCGKTLVLLKGTANTGEGKVSGVVCFTRAAMAKDD